MGDVGNDIKEALEEIGTLAVLTSDDSVSSYIKLSINNQATKPFIREHFLQAMIPYDTEFVPGNVIYVEENDAHYILMNLTEEFFENETIRYNGVIYKCNVQSGEVLRYSGEVWDDNYQKKPVFTQVYTGLYALVAEALYQNRLDEGQDFGLVDLKKQEFYIPKNYDIRVKDRVLVASGEYYAVNAIISHRYPGVNVLVLEEDTR